MYVRTTALTLQTRAQTGGSVVSFRAGVAEQGPGTERRGAWGQGTTGKLRHGAVGAPGMPPVWDTPEGTLTIPGSLGCATHRGLGGLPRQAPPGEIPQLEPGEIR